MKAALRRWWFRFRCQHKNGTTLSWANGAQSRRWMAKEISLLQWTLLDPDVRITCDACGKRWRP